MKFDWDPRKEAANFEKHGISFIEAQAAFEDPFAIVAFDAPHSPRGGHELRWWLFGRVGGRVMLVGTRIVRVESYESSVQAIGKWERKFMKKKHARIEKPAFNRAGYQIDMNDLNGEPLPDLSKLDFQPFKHGGARAGAGRKPSGRKALLLRLSPRLISALRKEAWRKHKTLSDVAEERLAHG